MFVVWEGGLRQHLAARSDGERASWLKAVEAASYRNVRATFIRLQKMLETRRDHNPDLDVAMWRLRCGAVLGLYSRNISFHLSPTCIIL